MITAKYVYPNNGYDYDKQKSKELLELNKEYVVKVIDMNHFHTLIRLEGFIESFNAVQFEFFNDGEEFNIYSDPRFNPHL